MSYVQKHRIGINDLLNPLSELLGEPLDSIKLDYQKAGFSGLTFKLTARRGNNSRLYLLKKVNDGLEYCFYKEVTSVVGITTPKMHGLITVEPHTYLIMDYIAHTPAKWNDKKRYLRLIDLLVQKDHLIQNNWQLVKESLSVESEVNYKKILEWISKISFGANLGINKSYKKLNRFLSFNRSKLKYIQNNLSKIGKLTVCHNDYQINNILFSKMDNKPYLIDWTTPNIGSVCIDLAKLINVAPIAFRKELLKYYQEAEYFEEFDILYPMAEVYNHLDVLSWVVDAVKDKQTEMVKYVDIEHKVNQVINLVPGIKS